jgi:Ser/Thr protein kinase RdoA (MazF antagonist)
VSLHPYAGLTPDRVLDAMEAAGFASDGRLLALNSYENRVYQVGIEGGRRRLVAKFYRPDRWSDEAILEEHAFATELAEAALPVAVPLAIPGHGTLFHHGGFRVAVFESLGGRAPELDRPAELKRMGRLVARLHNVSARGHFRHRARLDIEGFGRAPARYILDAGFVPESLEESWRTLTGHVLAAVEHRFEAAGAASLRLHGDAHPGNVLWRDDGPWLVDLDDSCSGPAIQDLWMFLSGERGYQEARLADLLSGYTEFRDFDARELGLIEALRSLRILHFNGWIARRWEDPAFPAAFPDFAGHGHWERQILALREQAALLQEAPLVWDPLLAGT